MPTKSESFLYGDPFKSKADQFSSVCVVVVVDLEVLFLDRGLAAVSAFRNSIPADQHMVTWYFFAGDLLNFYLGNPAFADRF